MLTLTRKIGESIRIGDDIVVVVKEIKGKQVRLGIEAPRDVYVCREELFMKIKQANEGALVTKTNDESVDTPDALTALGRLLLSRQPDHSPEVTPDVSHEDETRETQGESESTHSGSKHSGSKHSGSKHSGGQS